MLYICYILLLLKYFVIIKKGEIVAPWIDFDDYKIFEEVTNDFGLEKDLLYFRGKIIILSSSDSKASRARIEDLWSIGGNFIFLECVFWEKIRFKEKDRPLGSIPVKRTEWHAIFGWHTQKEWSYESTSVAV